MAQELQYVNEKAINPKLLCSICHLPFVDPAVTPCKHTFCSTCLNNTISKTDRKACPLCRKDLNMTEVRVLDPGVTGDMFVLDLLAELEVYCPRKQNGCNWKGPRANLEEHNSGCSFHVCTMFRAGCQFKGTQNAVNTHQNECPLMPTACPYSAQGCEVTLRRFEVPTHISQCPVAAEMKKKEALEKKVQEERKKQEQIASLEREKKAQEERIATEQRDRAKAKLERLRQDQHIDQVTVRVGAHTFSMLRSVLIEREPNSVLALLARAGGEEKSSEIKLNRNGDVYSLIFEWLSSGDISSAIPYLQMQQLKAEAEFLELRDLQSHLAPFHSRIVTLFNMASAPQVLEKVDFHNTSLAGYDFTDCFLDDASFRRCHLVRALFRKVSAVRTSFEGADLQLAVFAQCDLSNASFRDANLKNATFLACDLHTCSFKGAKLSHCILKNTDLKGLDLSEVGGLDLLGCDLRETKLPVSLSEMNLSGTNLEGVDLSDKDLTGANLAKCKLRGARLPLIMLSVDLSEADLSEVKFGSVAEELKEEVGERKGGEIRVELSSCKLAGANLTQADLRCVAFPPDLKGVKLSGSRLEFADLSSCELRGADLSQCDLRQTYLPADFAEANLMGVNLSSCDLSSRNFTKANLTGANLSAAVLTGSCLEGAMLAEADLQRADLSAATFKGANFAKCDLRTTRLPRDFSHTSLKGANLAGCDLTYVNFAHAMLTAANLAGADLTFANLSVTDLSSANLGGANLTAVKFSHTNLNTTNLQGATLGEINFGKTDLSRCDLRSTIFRRCELREAKLPMVMPPTVQMNETRWFSWSPALRGQHGTVDAERVASMNNQYCLVLADRVMESGEWEVVVTSPHNSIEVGMIREPFQDTFDRDFGRLQGWGFNCALRRLFSGVAGSNISQNYSNVSCKQGDRVKVRVNKAEGTIEYAINGQWKGVAFRGVSGLLRPAVSLYNQASISL